MRISSLIATSMLRHGLLVAGVCLVALGGEATAQGRSMMQDRDTMRLQDQLRDCRGDDCVPIREQMMTQLRERLQNCAGGECDEMRERLRLHEQVRDCHMSDRTCREMRMQERESVRPRYHYGDGMGGGMGRGMGGGMGGGMRN
jgi:hypothetical protein